MLRNKTCCFFISESQSQPFQPPCLPRPLCPYSSVRRAPRRSRLPLPPLCQRGHQAQVMTKVPSSQERAGIRNTKPAYKDEPSCSVSCKEWRADEVPTPSGMKQQQEARKGSGGDTCPSLPCRGDRYNSLREFFFH